MSTTAKSPFTFTMLPDGGFHFALVWYMEWEVVFRLVL